MKSTTTNHPALLALPPTNIPTKHRHWARVKMSLECSCCQLKAWDEDREKKLAEEKIYTRQRCSQGFEEHKVAHFCREIKHQNCILMFTKTLCMKINYFTSINKNIFQRQITKPLMLKICWVVPVNDISSGWKRRK